MAKNKNAINLGIVENVDHSAKSLNGAFGITEERAKIIKNMCLDITSRPQIRISEVLCDVAQQFDGNELLFAYHILSEIRVRAQSSCAANVIPIGDVGDIGKIIDRLMKRDEE